MPCRRCFPFFAVTAVVFEVTVLYELGIESAIGCIADVLEKDAHELVADVFLLVLVNGERRLDGAFQPRQVLAVVVHAL